MERILITGASGFIGSNLVKRIAKKYSLIIPTRSELLSTRGDFQVIIHLAAIKYNHKDKKEIYASNVALTKKLLLQNPNSHFIYISTWLAAYPKKAGYYAETKLRAEKLVQKLAKKYTIVRIPHIYSSRLLDITFHKLLLPVYLLVRYQLITNIEPMSISDLVTSIDKLIAERKRHLNTKLYIGKGGKLRNF